MMKNISKLKKTMVIFVPTLLIACHDWDSSLRQQGQPKQQNTITNTIDRTPKARILGNDEFTFTYPLLDHQTIRMVEQPKQGRLTIKGRSIHYIPAENHIGTDQFRLEIIHDSEHIMIAWQIRVDGDEPRFTELPTTHQDWQCVNDKTTHLGVTWAIPKEPQQQTFGWKNWNAELPKLEAQCFLEQGPCNTENLVDYANRHQWCGQSDWRLPYAYELKNLTSKQDFALDRNQAAIDPYFFPSVGFEYYWLTTDESDLQQDNLAHRYSFGRTNMQVSNQNKRRPASTILVSGAVRDQSLPSEQVNPQPESSSFIRLNQQGLPLTIENQQHDFTDTPWVCLDDTRSLVRDNLYLRDGQFSYVYWLTPQPSQITDTENQYRLNTKDTHVSGSHHTLDGVLQFINHSKQCGRQDWRVPTLEELASLLHQSIDGGDYTLLYQTSFNTPKHGLYWVKTEQGYGTLTLPNPKQLIVNDPEPNTEAKALFIATEFEPRASEDPRSINNHGQPNMARLRHAYASSTDEWPVPFVDDNINYQELGLMPQPSFPHNNPYQKEKVQLGKDLFFDSFLSKAKDVSCASCHDPQKGWTDHLEVSIGHDRQRGKRNAPSIVNSAFLPQLFWDGRATTLEQQALMPIQDPVEMAESLDNLVNRLNEHPTYPARFKTVFHQSPITAQQLAMALATFQRTIVSQKNRLDQFIEQARHGDTQALNDQELWGLDIYRRNGRCVNCHMGPELTDHGFENVGLTYYKGFYQDLGQYNVDGHSQNVGKFKTPSLRDTMNTGPWFHNGLVPTMEGVISMYSEGMASNAPFGWDKYDPNYPKLSEKIRPLNLTFQEREALKAFMHVITAPSPSQPATKAELGQ